MKDLVAEEVHICEFCDERMILTQSREQWSCPICFMPKPRTATRPQKVTAGHGQERE